MFAKINRWYRAGLTLITVMSPMWVNCTPTTRDDGRIRPYAENPFYWQYQGKPVLLLGGSWQDNLFNHPLGLERHLDLLKSVGGNYVRNVMSHRNVGNIFAFDRVDGTFDLDRWNDEYWRRFENFLKLTHERDIIVQIEIWATWDHYEDHQSLGGWSKHPFNPANNITYTAEETGLPVYIHFAPQSKPTDHPFFRSVPALDNNERLLKYQTAFVDKLLSYSLKYPHVLYCMNNETGEHVAWGDYWADHVRRRAEEAGVEVHITDMRRNETIRAEDHRHIFDHPERYTFLDISQNNAWEGIGQKHYDNILYVRDYIAQKPRPINNNKNYGAARHGEEESVARFCRIVFAGCAGVRFHRPHPLETPDAHEAATEVGLGLSPRAQAIIASMRKVADAIDIFRTEPRNDLLTKREDNEAYCLAEPGRQYAVYFPDGGDVLLNVSDSKGSLSIRWLDINNSVWLEAETITADENRQLKAPGSGHWAAVIKTIN